VPQSRAAAASRTRTRAQQLAIAVLALLTHGSAGVLHPRHRPHHRRFGQEQGRPGTGPRVAAGCGSGQLHAGTGKLTAGFATLAGRLNSPDPSSPGVVLGTQLLADGTAKIRTGIDGVSGDPERPGLLAATARMTEGSSRPADGTVALNAGITGDPGDPARPGLLSGSQALATGASELSEGNTTLASGSTQLATGTDKLADGNARIADGTGTLHSGAAAVSPTWSGSPTRPRPWDSWGSWDWAPRVRSSCCARSSHSLRLPRPTAPAGSRPRVRGNPGPAPRRG
jgi:X-X-X-Leu-X-X-Gly heptad repeat protein